jgi:hypothetical protein
MPVSVGAQNALAGRLQRWTDAVVPTIVGDLGRSILSAAHEMAAFQVTRTVKSLTRWLPGIDMLRRYQTAWLPHDIFAGLVLVTMLVPVGIA